MKSIFLTLALLVSFTAQSRSCFVAFSYFCDDASGSGHNNFVAWSQTYSDDDYCDLFDTKYKMAFKYFLEDEQYSEFCYAGSVGPGANVLSFRTNSELRNYYSNLTNQCRRQSPGKMCETIGQIYIDDYL